MLFCVSEGIHDNKGTFICGYDNSVALILLVINAGRLRQISENLVRSRLGVKARSIELNVSQRCSASMLSDTDRQEAITAGIFGVQAALKGETGKMVSFIRQETSEGVYQMRCGLEDVNEICNEEKTVPLSWISQDGSDVTEDFIHYARPLIQGNVELPMGEDGLHCLRIQKITLLFTPSTVTKYPRRSGAQILLSNLPIRYHDLNRAKHILHVFLVAHEKEKNSFLL